MNKLIDIWKYQVCQNSYQTGIIQSTPALLAGEDHELKSYPAFA